MKYTGYTAYSYAWEPSDVTDGRQLLAGQGGFLAIARYYFLGACSNLIIIPGIRILIIKARRYDGISTIGISIW